MECWTQQKEGYKTKEKKKKKRMIENSTKRGGGRGERVIFVGLVAITTEILMSDQSQIDPRLIAPSRLSKTLVAIFKVVIDLDHN